MPAFNEEVQTAFACYLAVQKHNYCIADEIYEQYVTHITNIFYAPTNVTNLAKQVWVKVIFKTDEAGYAVYAYATENRLLDPFVIKKSSIIDIIQESIAILDMSGIHPS